MSTFSFSESSRELLATWETDGQVQWLRIDSRTGARSTIVTAPGSTRNRKHPVIAVNPRGETLLAWTEGTAWNRGGELVWQVFDSNSRLTAGAFRVYRRRVSEPSPSAPTADSWSSIEIGVFSASP